MSGSDLLLGFRFGVCFFAGGVTPNSIDIRFQKVRGLAATVKTTPLSEGGQNLYTQQLPNGVEHGNVIFERGIVVGSPLNLEFNAAMTLFTFAPSHVQVMLFDDARRVVLAWWFDNAYPVKWSTSDLDATQKTVLIDNLELAHAGMRIMRL